MYLLSHITFFLLSPRLLSLQTVQFFLLLAADPVRFPDLLDRFIVCKVIHRVILEKLSCLFREFHVTYLYRSGNTHLCVIPVIPDLSAAAQYLIDMLCIHEV